VLIRAHRFSSLSHPLTLTREGGEHHPLVVPQQRHHDAPPGKGRPLLQHAPLSGPRSMGSPRKTRVSGAEGQWPGPGRPAPPSSRERLRRRWCVLPSSGQDRLTVPPLPGASPKRTP
jgi:hypothetical protein